MPQDINKQYPTTHSEPCVLKRIKKMKIIKRRMAPGLSQEGKTHKMTQQKHTKNVLI